MGKKMKLPFLFKPSDTTTRAAASGGAWPWPTCVNNPKTLSFRENIYKTMNSAYSDEKQSTTDSFFSITNSFDYRHDDNEETVTCFPNPEDSINSDSAAVLRGLKSERLFFQPGETNSILEEAKSHDFFPYKESAAIMVMDSRDPFVDFRVSMEEMVDAHKLKSWECLEELLTTYLKVNSKSNHGYIVSAFVDLLLRLSTMASASASASNSDSNDSFTSPLISFSNSSSTDDSSTSQCQSSGV